MDQCRIEVVLFASYIEVVAGEDGVGRRRYDKNSGTRRGCFRKEVWDEMRR